MPCLLLYDIPNDRLRTKVSEICMDYGLDRIQYSAFSGQLSKTHRKELWTQIKREIGDKVANVQLIQVSPADWKERIVIAQKEKEE